MCTFNASRPRPREMSNFFTGRHPNSGTKIGRHILLSNKQRTHHQFSRWFFTTFCKTILSHDISKKKTIYQPDNTYPLLRSIKKQDSSFCTKILMTHSLQRHPMWLHNVKQHNVNVTCLNVTKSSCTQGKSFKT